MPSEVEQFDRAIVGTLRGMALRGQLPSEMVREVKRHLRAEVHTLTLLGYFRQAFFLTLAEAKPLAALTRNEQREIENEPLLNDLLSPAILIHRSDWNGHNS